MKKAKIIIVGAGIAGLAAANALSAHYDVILLEARNRWGGRIWIDHSLGISLSRGAAWVHGAKGNPLVGLATQFPTELSFFDNKKFYLFDRHGHRINNQTIYAFKKKMEAALEKSRNLALTEKEDVALSVALSRVMPISHLSLLEQDLFERQLRFFENYIGAEYELLSARYWNEEENAVGENAFLSDSYEAILKGLATPCFIRFNRP